MRKGGPLQSQSEDEAITYLVSQFRRSLLEHRGTLTDAIRHGHADLAFVAQVRQHRWYSFSVERVKVVGSAA